jgi:hypothetical protein
MDFVIRLFIRFSHNLLISNCCSYGIEESIQETTRASSQLPSETDVLSHRIDPWISEYSQTETKK